MKELHIHPKTADSAVESQCTDCLYFDTPADDPDGEPCCTMQYHMDEDERAMLSQSRHPHCPYYRQYDEYKSVRRQN